MEEEEIRELTNAELEELMIQRGLQKLEEHQRFVSCDGTIETGSMKYKYGVDFKLGDIVSVYSQRLNIIANLQIVSVTKSISNGVEYFDITFGHDRLSVSKLSENQVIVVPSGSSSGSGSGGNTGTGPEEPQEPDQPSEPELKVYNVRQTSTATSSFSTRNGLSVVLANIPEEIQGKIKKVVVKNCSLNGMLNSKSSYSFNLQLLLSGNINVIVSNVLVANTSYSRTEVAEEKEINIDGLTNILSLKLACSSSSTYVYTMTYWNTYDIDFYYEE